MMDFIRNMLKSTIQLLYILGLTLLAAQLHPIFGFTVAFILTSILMFA